jgi:hypothetical protein
MGKCYNLSFDSTSYFGGLNNNKRTYFVDWGFLPNNKAFKVRFSYMSVAATTILNTSSVMSLHINLGSSDNFWANATGSTISTQNLGCLRVGTTAGGTNGYYYAELESNTPIYIKSKPCENNVEVELHSGLSVFLNYNTPIPTEYILTLNFEEVDDY